MIGVHGRRGFFGKNNERGFAALFIAADSAEKEWQSVFAAEKYFLFVFRPFVKPVCGYQAALLEKVFSCVTVSDCALMSSPFLPNRSYPQRANSGAAFFVSTGAVADG